MPNSACVRQVVDAQFESIRWLVIPARKIKVAPPAPYVKVPQESERVAAARRYQHLLCADCEDRFNKLGEKWILANMFLPTAFRLQQLLPPPPPIFVPHQTPSSVYTPS